MSSTDSLSLNKENFANPVHAEFINKLERDTSVNYLLYEYKELVAIFQKIKTLKVPDMFQILLAAEKDNIKFTNIIEKQKVELQSFSDELKKKELELLTMKSYKKKMESIEKKQTQSPDKFFQEMNSMKEFILDLRGMLDLERQSTGSLYLGIEERLEEIIQKKQEENANPSTLFTIHSEQRDNNVKQLQEENDNLVQEINYLRNEFSVMKKERRSIETSIKKKSRKMSKFYEIIVRKTLESMKMENAILKNDVLQLRSFFHRCVHELRQKLSREPLSEIGSTAMKNFHHTKYSSNGFDTKNLANIWNNTNKNHSNTAKKLLSQPLNLDELRHSLNLLSTKHSKELHKFFKFAKTYFLETNVEMKSSYQAEHNLNQIKMKALRDEFLSRQEKINDINRKIKDLSLFKLEIEADLREYSRDYIGKMEIQIRYLKCRYLESLLHRAQQKISGKYIYVGFHTLKGYGVRENSS